jgi:hypothetical protein
MAAGFVTFRFQTPRPIRNLRFGPPGADVIRPIGLIRLLSNVRGHPIRTRRCRDQTLCLPTRRDDGAYPQRSVTEDQQSGQAQDRSPASRRCAGCGMSERQDSLKDSPLSLRIYNRAHAHHHKPPQTCKPGPTSTTPSPVHEQTNKSYALGKSRVLLP